MNARPQDEEKYKRALNIAIDLNLQNSSEYIACCAELRTWKGYPANWDIIAVIQRDVWKPQVANQTLLNAFQKMIVQTFIRKYTRDRKGQQVPTRLQVEAVIEIQQPSTYISYIMRRDEIRNELKKLPSYIKYNTLDSQGVKTFKAQPSWTGRDMGELCCC